MTLHILLAKGGPAGGPSGPIGNPGLSVWRTVGSLGGLSQNSALTGGPYNVPWSIKAEASRIRVAFSGYGGQAGPISWTTSCAVDGVPLTVNGATTFTIPADRIVVTDELDIRVQPGQVLNLTIAPTTPHPPMINIPTDNGSSQPVPGPTAIIGRTYATQVSPIIVGDSIAYQGFSPVDGWVRFGLGELPGMDFATPVTRWTSLNDGRYGDNPTEVFTWATHMLIQFGVNDINNTLSLTELKASARASWAWHRARFAGPIYQTTPTPIVVTNDLTATLEGQTVPVSATRRPDVLAWLRDGAPDESGVRAGQPGHPLAGIVDIAAAVESPTAPGKWDSTQGALGGDGVHPSPAGQAVMAQVVSEWVEGLSS